MTTIKCMHEGRYQIGRGKPLDFDDHKGMIYYYLNNIGSAYDRTETEYRINAAFDEWNKHFAPLRFMPTGNRQKAYIQIYFTGIKPRWRWLADLFPGLRRMLSIEPIPFDDDTYAYGFECGHTEWAGHIYINDLIDWSDREIALTKVLIHEAGHVFNIGHTQLNHSKEIMLDYYSLDHMITEDTLQIINLPEMYATYKAKYLPNNNTLPNVTQTLHQT